MDRTERIRQRAHEIWEREGRPEGRQEAHWEEACRDIEAAEGGAEHPNPRAPRDPDTGAALAADPTGWVSRRSEDMAGEGEPASPDAPAKRGRRKSAPRA